MENNCNCNSYRFSHKFVFILFLFFVTNQKQESDFQQVSVFCLQQVALSFKAITNLINFCKGILLHVICFRIIVPCSKAAVLKNLFLVSHQTKEMDGRTIRFFFHLNSQWRLQEAKKFSRNPSQFEYVTKDRRCHVSVAVLLIQNLQSQVAQLARRPGTMLKIHYFSWGGH